MQAVSRPWTHLQSLQHISFSAMCMEATWFWFFTAPDCLLFRDDGGYFGLALLNDWPSVIQQHITAAQSRQSQIETHVSRQLQESASDSVKHLTRPRDISRWVSRRTDGQLVHYRPPLSDVEMGSSASLRTSLQSRGPADINWDVQAPASHVVYHYS